MQQDLYMIVLNNFQEKPFDYVWCFRESTKKIFPDKLQWMGGGCLHSESQKKPVSTHFRDWGFGPDAHYVLLLKVSCSYTCLVHWHVVCVNATSIL